MTDGFTELNRIGGRYYYSFEVTFGPQWLNHGFCYEAIYSSSYLLLCFAFPIQKPDDWNEMYVLGLFITSLQNLTLEL